MESSESLLKKALQLKPQDRFQLIDGLIRSLDEPDKEIDEIWSEEAERSLKAHREGKTQGVSFKSVFAEDL
ncbi:MAG: addiction module protein [Desulfobacterales bacterium]|jgi:putative addiction module component (TIGR02574 family)